MGNDKNRKSSKVGNFTIISENNIIQNREEQFFDKIANESKLNSESLSIWDNYALNLLGNIHDKKILEIGCGTGFLTLELGKRGANVTAIDISSNAIEIANGRIKEAKLNKKVKFYNYAFEKTSLPPNEFNLIFGKWILHHLDYKKSIDKIFSYLAPSGRAIFIETSYLNPIIRFTRKYLSGRCGIRKIGSIDEKPLGYEEIAYVKNIFKKVNLYFPEFSFFWLFDRHILQYNKLRYLGKLLNGMDQIITLHFPKLNKYGYYLILECVK